VDRVHGTGSQGPRTLIKRGRPSGDLRLGFNKSKGYALIESRPLVQDRMARIRLGGSSDGMTGSCGGAPQPPVELTGARL
jgi:hypothetical protein